MTKKDAPKKSDGVVRDDNLRLILSAQEGDYIRTSIKTTKRKSLFFGGVVVLAPVLTFEAFSQKDFLLPFLGDFELLFLIAILSGISLSIIAVINTTLSVFSLYRYKKMQREHDAFLAKYERKVSD